MTSGSVLTVQHGGSHYLGRSIQPVQFWAANGWDAFSGSILKYITRWRQKNGLEDLLKAKHFAEMRMELHGAIPVRRVITMNEYVKSNAIAWREDAALIALEGWVGAGEAGNEPDLRYHMFLNNIDNLIEAVRDGY